MFRQEWIGRYGLWTTIRLWFVKTRIGVDGKFYTIVKELNGKFYLISQGEIE